MNAIKDRWLPPLRELAHNISRKYERLFEHMKCVGEVVLVEGNPNVSFIVFHENILSLQCDFLYNQYNAQN